jgi:hypothetical protein
LIDSYEFGVVIVNGEKYTSDIVVLPDGVVKSWWRKEDHRLRVEDLQDVLNVEPKPEVLVVGTGYYGLVKISSEVEYKLESSGIELIAKPTTDACKIVNDLLKSNRKVAAAFHLTC